MNKTHLFTILVITKSILQIHPVREKANPNLRKKSTHLITLDKNKNSILFNQIFFSFI